MDIKTIYLSAMRAELTGTVAKLSPLTQTQWEELLLLAGAQKTLPLVYGAVYRDLLRDVPKLYTAVRREALRQTAIQTARSVAFGALYEKLGARGLQPVVVKGAACRWLYNHPDERQSADEDLLVWDAFDACCRALTEEGLQPMSAPDGEEQSFFDPEKGLYLELHREPFEKTTGWNCFFDGARDHTQSLETETRLCVLSPHDHMLYLILHAMKHFIHSGFGIRQVSDIGLWAGAYRERINWPLLWKQCQAARAEKFSAAVFRLAEMELGLTGPEGIWLDLPQDYLPLLEDILSGGVYGGQDRNRMHSAAITASGISAHPVLSAVFPGRDKLIGRYPWLNNRPYLLPAAWCDRLWKYSREKGANSAKSVELAYRRMTLLRGYGIID